MLPKVGSMSGSANYRAQRTFRSAVDRGIGVLSGPKLRTRARGEFFSLFSTIVRTASILYEVYAYV